MHNPLPLIVASAVAALVVAGSANAGQAEVSFTQPEQFADAGTSPRERDDNLRVLADYLQRLCERLPAEQTLTVEVTDVDLAGRVLPSTRSQVRVATGGADWPRIKLRYALRAHGQTLRSGEETVADLGYLQHGATSRSTEPLRHEKRMLDDWFASRFAPTHAASR